MYQRQSTFMKIFIHHHFIHHVDYTWRR